MKSKHVFLFMLFFSFSSIFAENFKIENVEYKIQGLTTQNSLKKLIPIDKKTIFKSEGEFNKYLDNLKISFLDTRVFETVDIEILSFEKQSLYTKVDLLISTKDSWNLIAIPYPSYDSNTGFKLRLKIKDYNFLGSLNVFDCSLNYEYDLEKDKNYIKFDFVVPFPTINLFSFDTSFLIDFDLSYVVGNKSPGYKTGQSIVFSRKFSKNIALEFSVNNNIYVEPSQETMDKQFFVEDTLSLSFPIKLATINNISSIMWTPRVNFNFNWNINGINTRIDRSLSSFKDLYDPSLSFGHNIYYSNITWKNNFRKGFDFSIAQLFNYNFNSKSFTSAININSHIHNIITNHFGLSTQLQLFINPDGNYSEKGSLLRGIKNDLYFTNSAIIGNFDLPIKLFQTDWVSFFDNLGLNWNWTKLFDFEFQINPFFDMSIGYNPYTKTTYLIEDGFYSNGFEILVYPNKMKSVTARVSLGFDTVKTLKNIGKNLDFVDKLTEKLFNTNWRTGSEWEIYIGVGLFY